MTATPTARAARAPGRLAAWAAALTRPAPARTPPAALSPASAPRPPAAPAAPATGGARLRAWAELLRLPALFTVPGDVLAGTAATGARPGARTALAIGSSLCLYEAGMALNDWADREEDAVARPHRPLPSGRIRPGAALAAAGTLTAAGLLLARAAGRGALTAAVPLAATVWAYDLRLKHTPAGPAAMAAARGLDLLLGAACATGPIRPALAPAAVLAGHTGAVTLVSRREAEGGSTTAPLTALAAVSLLSATLARPPAATARTAPAAKPAQVVRAATVAAYAVTFARPLVLAALHPSPVLTQRAVGAGIRATMALQGALMARAGALGAGVASTAFVPWAARLARKVATT